MVAPSAPVWDVVQGTGTNALYLVSAFTKVRIIDYALPGGDPGLEATFLGYATCGS